MGTDNCEEPNEKDKKIICEQLPMIMEKVKIKCRNMIPEDLVSEIQGRESESAGEISCTLPGN